MILSEVHHPYSTGSTGDYRVPHNHELKSSKEFKVLGIVYRLYNQLVTDMTYVEQLECPYL